MIEPAHVVALPKGQCFALTAATLESPHAAAGTRPRRSHAEGSAGAGWLHAAALRRGQRLVGARGSPACRTRPCPTTCSMSFKQMASAHGRGRSMSDACVAAHEAATTAGLIAGTGHAAVPLLRGAERRAAARIVIDASACTSSGPIRAGATRRACCTTSWISSLRISRAARWCRSRAHRARAGRGGLRLAVREERPAGRDTRRLGAARVGAIARPGFPLLHRPRLCLNRELPDRGGLHDAGLLVRAAGAVPDPAAVPDGRLRRLVDGLVRRDIRRFGAGRESGFISHRARASLIPLAVLPWVTYLALPVSVNPLLILLPSAALLGLAVYP